MRRQRKVAIDAFVSSLVLGFPTATHGTLAGLRRRYALGTGERGAAFDFERYALPIDVCNERRADLVFDTNSIADPKVTELSP